MNKIVFAAFSIIAFIFSPSHAAQSSGFFSNEIVSLSGSHDTISLLTGKFDKLSQKETYSISYISRIDSAYISNDANWKTIVFSNNMRPRDLAFGQGISVVSFDTSTETSTPNINDIYLIDHKSNTSSKFEMPWNNSLKILADSSKIELHAFSVTYLNGSFYFACHDGGLVKWNIGTNAKSIFLPGVGGAVTDTFKGITDPLKSLTGVETVGDFLVITTPSNVWRFSPSDSTWTEYGSKSADLNLSIASFEYSFADPFSATHPLYSIASVKYNSTEDTLLCKYSAKDGGWKVIINKEVSGFTFGSKGMMYTLFQHDSTNCEIYQDTLGDSAVPSQPFYPINNYLPGRFTRSNNNSVAINDIQYIKSTDSSGILWVATSNGLYLCDDEISGKSTDSLLCIKRVVPVKSDLKEAIACPGILKYDDYDQYKGHVKFIYNLSKDAKVTIKIYDFNMDLVKTVIDKRPRKAGSLNAESGRSNNKLEDLWDGHTSTGRMCAPGVYYFKITTDIGEHAFGKIVVAK